MPAETVPADLPTRRQRHAATSWVDTRWLTWLVYLLGLVPAISVLRRIQASPLLPFVDYWAAFTRVTNPDGSFRLRGVFSYNNEHPFVVPNLVYYVDARWFEGTNHFAGYYSWALAIITIALVSLILPRDWPPLGRAAMTLAAATVIFLPSGLWNFVRGMSGVAWFSANVFALLAIYFASRRWTIPAVIVAGLALISYGTGFGAPLALIVLAIVRREKRWRWILPAGLFVVAAIIYAATANGGASGQNNRDVALFIKTFLSNVGMLWDSTGGPVAIVAGAAGLAILIVGFFTAWNRTDRLQLAPWWAIATYSITASALISVARAEVFEGDGGQGRYVSLSALFWIAVGVIGLRLIAAHRPVGIRVAAIVATIGVFYAASPTLTDQATSLDKIQTVIAAGLRVDAAGPESTYIPDPDAVSPRLKALGDYPFTKGYTFGCGLRLGDQIPASKLQVLPLDFQNGTSGSVDANGVVAQNATRFAGWVRRGLPADCAVIIDSAGRVVGGGAANEVRGDVPGTPNTVGYEALAPATAKNLRMVLGYSDGYWIQPPPPPTAAAK
jgi:hypothetical protein